MHSLAEAFDIASIVMLAVKGSHLEKGRLTPIDTLYTQLVFRISIKPAHGHAGTLTIVGVR